MLRKSIYISQSGILMILHETLVGRGFGRLREHPSIPRNVETLGFRIRIFDGRAFDPNAARATRADTPTDFSGGGRRSPPSGSRCRSRKGGARCRPSQRRRDGVPDGARPGMTTSRSFDGRECRARAGLPMDAQRRRRRYLKKSVT